MLRVNLAERGGLLVEADNFEPVNITNPPEPTFSSMDAPDAARLKLTSRLPLDPKLATVLIQEKQFGLLETLMNHPQLSPPGGIVNTDYSSNIGNMSLDLPAEVQKNKLIHWLWCQLSDQVRPVNTLLERRD
jgi:hypothetical protein